jgi:hypothetical protein
MELGSFTVEFFAHVPPPARESTLTLFSIRGASIERHTDRLFRVVCTEPKQLSFVGQRAAIQPGFVEDLPSDIYFWHRESKGEGIRCNKTLAFYRDGCRAL